MSGAGKNDHAELGIELRPLHGINQLLDGFRSKGIASPGPIDDNAGDALGKVATNIGVGLAGGASLPVESGADHLGGFLNEGATAGGMAVD